MIRCVMDRQTTVLRIRTKQWMQNTDWDSKALLYLPESIVADMYASGIVPQGRL